jgi:hypothetical protein
LITCPSCGNKELEGALFCKECGSQLLVEEKIKTTTIKREGGSIGQTKSGKLGVSKVLNHAPSSGALVTLHLIGRDAYLPVTEEGEVILGRSSEGQSMIPDIDLGKFQAFQSGVSRMHAAIRLFGDQMLITDLGSSNGTSVNDQKLEPYTPHPLKNGDILSLGKFRIEVITKTGKSS